MSSLPQATVGSAYSASVVSSIAGGTAPYQYQTATLTDGAPPLGMILNPNGDLTGTPMAPGQYDFSVCATDSAGNTSPCQPTSITVVPENTTSPPPPSPPSPPPASAPSVSLTASPTSITSGASSTLTWSSTNASSCTSSGGWSGTRGTSGSLKVSPTSTTTYTLDCSNSTGSAKASSTITVNAASPPPATGTSWVYYNGLFDWPGDYSFSATANYKDTGGGPLSGAYDIKITLTGAWGGWLPYAQNWNFNSAPYTKLTFALKPTVANQTWNVYFVKVGDIPVGVSVDPTKYGPAPVVGQWGTYTIPLADLGVLGMSIYKFAIHDETGLSSNVWYVDNVGFVP
jgi:hypothetical protein